MGAVLPRTGPQAPRLGRNKENPSQHPHSAISRARAPSALTSPCAFFWNPHFGSHRDTRRQTSTPAPSSLNGRHRKRHSRCYRRAPQLPAGALFPAGPIVHHQHRALLHGLQRLTFGPIRPNGCIGPAADDGVGASPSSRTKKAIKKDLRCADCVAMRFGLRVSALTGRQVCASEFGAGC